MEVYVARDKNDSVYLYTCKPYKSKSHGYWLLDYSKWLTADRLLIEEADLPEDINPQWEDDEPIKVNLKIEKI